MAARRERTPRREAAPNGARGPARPRGAAARPGPRSGYQLGDAEVERLLVSGAHRGLLEDYFGEARYRELSALARKAAARRARGGPRVLLLPGLMGSRLGRARKLPWDDVLWIDPFDIARGRLEQLALGRDRRIRALGVILFAYLELKLRLVLAGFDVALHPYDWRRSLDELGAQLARRIREDEAPEIHLVAHSMGGLVCRAALARDDRKLGRLVMLGPPNFGSFVPVQAIRATHPLVRSVARLDLANSARDLAETVLKTFPGLLQLLPSPKRWTRFDLYDRRSWPDDAPRPRQRLLDRCVPVQERLAGGDERFFVIAGVNQETTTDLTLSSRGVEYESSPAGDGVVPLEFAGLPGASTWVVSESHGCLANNRRVARAVIELLWGGATNALPREWDRGPTSAPGTVPGSALAAAPLLAGGELGPDECRALLEPLVSAESHDPVGPFEAESPEGSASGYRHSLRNVRVDHTDRHAIVLCLARGDIGDVEARALVLGLFHGVEPAGAASAIDQRLDGAVKELTLRRMFDGGVGEIFALPTGRHLIHAENVLFAGLGDYASFGPGVQRLVAENVVRTCILTHIEDFASVLIGTGSGASVESTVQSQLRGYVRALEDADPAHRIRRITLCEKDPDRFLRMKQEILRLATTPLFAHVELLFDEITLPPAAFVSRRRRRTTLAPVPRLTYLYVTEEQRSARTALYRSSVLTSGARATVLTGRQEVPLAALRALLETLGAPGFGSAALERFGRALAGLTLERSVARGLRELGRQPQHLVVVHDAPASLVPWETLCIDGWFPAAEGGMSRRYAAENLSVAKWLEQRRSGPTLDVLLVANPTEDLPGAEREARRVVDAFPQGDSRVRLTVLRGAAASRERVLAELASGRHDVVHYAGHAFFDPTERSRSGIVCAHHRVLSGRDLAGVAHLPALLFFNACESARLRRRGRKAPRGRHDAGRRIERNIGLAEALLRGGAASYVGTYWPVGDAAAAEFAPIFYEALLGGRPIGEAVQTGRSRVRSLGDADWADYVHYGSYDFRVKAGDRE